MSDQQQQQPNEQQLNEQQKIDDQKFFENIDAYIALANAHETSNRGAPQLVGASLIFAAARYNTFLVARANGEPDAFNAKKDEAKAYFMDQFSKMLDDNWADYNQNFEQYRIQK